MELLNPEKIKDDKKARVDEQIERSQEAAKEETRITRELNTTREKAKEENEKLIAEMKANLDAEITPLINRKKDLTERVQSLEERRKKALEPIKDIQKAAEDHMQRAKTRHDEAEVRETAIRTREDELDTKFDEIATIREELRAREDRIKRREEGLEVAEVISAASQADLTGKLVAYHNNVIVFNESVKTKELYLAEREAKCLVVEKHQGEENLKISQAKTELADRKLAFAREVNRNKNT